MKKVFTAVILLSIVSTLGLTACSDSEDEKQSTSEPTDSIASPVVEEVPQYGGELVVTCGAGEPRHFNSAIASGSATGVPATQIFASPLRYDDQWNPQPYLAKSWSFSADNLSLTLNLVENANFHDGHPVTSEDVAFSIMTVKQYHPFGAMFAPVETIETPDAYTVIIHLSQPHPAILLSMSPNLLPILPKHIYGDGQDILTHPANLKPVGCGPFKFVEYVPGSKVVLERNDDYFIEGRPYLDGITFRIVIDETVMLLDMERQEAHMLDLYSNPLLIKRLMENENLISSSQGYDGIGPISWLAFNLLRPPLDNKQVRQAIAYAIDTDFITRYLLQGVAQNAYGPIIPNSPFYDESIPKYNIDLKKAGQMLDRAGFPVREDGIRFSLTLDFIPTLPSVQEEVARLIQNQLSKVGIEVELIFSEGFPQWASKIGDWDFDMTMDVVYNWGDPVIGVHRTYMSSNIRKGAVWSNTQNYSNSRVDDLLKQAATETDFGKRQKLYNEFQQIVTEELPVMPINVMPYHTIYNKNLGNPPLTIWGVHSPLDEVYWKEFIERPLPEQATIDDSNGNPQLRQIGQKAIALLRQSGLYDSLPVLADPENGFLGLEETGLLVIGVTEKGDVFLDNSGQLKPGMDISPLLGLEGDRILPRLISAANGENGGYLIMSGGFLPHPVTGEMEEASLWCGWLYRGDMICVLKWN